ncbi:MAG: hypothetical protein H8E44_11235 [Planctomycetes bacterium]|nr:hypothetical protein [Planctomycetota bacterium]
MRGHGRPTGGFIARLLAVAVLVAAVGQATRSIAEPSRFPQEFLRDAGLTDVFFVDPDRGWAVGDRGVIWQTDDGGRHWQLQSSPVPCRLESVSFVDDRNGWIVGGWSHPYTHNSTGVVLRTTDGGQRWQQIPRLSLPALRGVKFFDHRIGWALGNASATYPAGVFRTEDGGRSWSSVPAQVNSGWLAGDFQNRNHGAVAGRNGAVATVHASGPKPTASPNVGLRHVRCVRLSSRHVLRPQQPYGPNPDSQGAGWLVGDGGLVLCTTDGGLSWREPIGRLPDGMYDQFDFRALAVLGDHCWVAGSPGTRVLHSPDGGRSWQVFDTGESLPIHALTFLDADRGWAVGSLGAILVTRDGGRTWVPQQQGGSRVAILGIFSEPQKIPLELLTRLAGNEGYLSAVEITCRRDVEVDVAEQASLESRTCEAMASVGGSQAGTAWNFPLRQPGLSLPARSIVAGWDEVHQGHGQKAFEAYIVRKIRQWRPDVVLTEPASPRGDHPLSHLTNQATLAAVERAADAAAYPRQITLAGLEPWKTKRAFSSLGGDVQGSLNITTSQLAPRLGRSLGDQARYGWELIRYEYQPPPQTYGFRRVVDRLPDEPGQRDFFSGISLHLGGGARRMLNAPQPGDVRTLGRLAQRRRNIQHLLKYAAGSGQGGAAWLGQAEDLIRGLDESASGEVLYELAYGFHRSGAPELAADVLDFLARRHPNHPLSEPALLWLTQYYASAEVGWIAHRQTEELQETAIADDPVDLPEPDSVEPASFESPVGPPRSKLYKRSAVAGPSLTDRALRATTYGQLVQNSRPSLFVEPELRFPLAVADRLAGRFQEAERFYHFTAANRNRDAWGACAQSEIWLLRPGRVAPKPVATCTKAAGRPQLDARLDDDVWQSCTPIPLASRHRDDVNWPAAVMLAHDDEFLYLSVSCHKAPDAVYPTSESPRPRDPDLSDRDRVEFYLDVDRDYATYYRLVVDHRGWVSETCFGSASWNPQWYVAAAQDDRTWTVEAAIAWSELVERAPGQGEHWSAGIQRVVPRVGFQSWTQPAAVSVRAEGFGLLTFE